MTWVLRAAHGFVSHNIETMIKSRFREFAVDKRPGSNTKWRKNLVTKEIKPGFPFIFYNFIIRQSPKGSFSEVLFIRLGWIVKWQQKHVLILAQNGCIIKIPVPY